MALCKKCGQREQHTFPNGRTIALCAVCGWNAIVEFLESPDVGGLIQREADFADCHACGITYPNTATRCSKCGGKLQSR